MVLEMDDAGSVEQRYRAGGAPVLLKASDLWFAYNRRTPVLSGVDMTVAAGRMAMVLGRSGSGKTTLLKVLKGLLRPQRGTVTLHLPPNGARRPAGRIAYIPQTLGLVRSMTALENTLTGALSRVGTVRSVARAFPREVLEEARETLAGLGIAHKEREPVYNLSGGERQRVAIGRALMQRPALILADEFVSQLDHITAEEILDTMHRLAEGGVGLLVTTHEIDVVVEHADEVVVMRGGTVTHRSEGAGLTVDGLLGHLR